MQRGGCQVRTAENGLEALEIFKQEPIDIVFTDLVMPLVGGEQLCRVIRQMPDRSTVFIVVISAIPVAEATPPSGMPVGPVMSTCRDYGFANALPKPYIVDDLRNILSLGP